MTRLSKSERYELCDDALRIGEDQPTLSGDWTVKELVVHLLVREGSPAAAGIVVAPLAPYTKRVTRRLMKRDFTELVEQLRNGPPIYSPYAIPKVDTMVNTLEYFVHHEDIRRAQPSWEPRELSPRHEKQLWNMITVAGKGLVRGSTVGVTIERSDREGRQAVLNEGEHPVVVRGLPSEITLFVFGRKPQARVELSGTDDAVAALRDKSLGI
jgi:uncharacterized protein (TIGR03085 family)